MVAPVVATYNDPSLALGSALRRRRRRCDHDYEATTTATTGRQASYLARSRRNQTKRSPARNGRSYPTRTRTG